MRKLIFCLFFVCLSAFALPKAMVIEGEPCPEGYECIYRKPTAMNLDLPKSAYREPVQAEKVKPVAVWSSVVNLGPVTGFFVFIGFGCVCFLLFYVALIARDRLSHKRRR